MYLTDISYIISGIDSVNIYYMPIAKLMYKTAVYALVNGVNYLHIKNSKYQKSDITQHDIA